MFKFNFQLPFIYISFFQKKEEDGLGKQYLASTLKPLVISSNFQAALRSFSFSLSS